MTDLGSFSQAPRVPTSRESETVRTHGHDYSDHIVDYKGKAILDTQLPEGAKGSPITGPGWTEVDSEQWSNEYKHKQRRRKAAWN